MTDKIYNVLFICTGNSARSIIGEAVMNKLGEGRFKAYSAGSKPQDEIHPMALSVLTGMGYETDGMHPKSWEEFSKPGSPQFDFIFTVCDKAAGETCPIWIGQPITAHWGIEDPANVQGTGQHEAFLQALRYLANRISLLMALPISSIDEMAMRQKLKEIGRSEGASPGANV